MRDRTDSTIGFIPPDLLSASIALVLLAFFVAVGRDRVAHATKEREVLQSVAGEFRRSLKSNIPKSSVSESIFRKNRETVPGEVELLGTLDLLFSESGGLTEPGAAELSRIASLLKSGDASLRLIFISPFSSIEGEAEEFLEMEAKARRLKTFLLEQGAPPFSVDGELAFGTKEAFLVRLRGAGSRVRWE